MKFVRSYRGKRAEDNTAFVHNSFNVSDYMATKLITFKSGQTMHEVIETLLKHRISGAPVVNEKNDLIGVISEGNCLKQITESRYHNLPLTEATVDQSMTREVITINGDMSIFDAASKFLNSRIRRFPVISDGKLIGQISQKDIMKAVLDHKGSTWDQK